MMHMNRYNDYYNIAKVIFYSENTLNSSPGKRLQIVAVYFLLDYGFTFDEIAGLRKEDYKDNVIYSPNFIAYVKAHDALWDHVKKQKQKDDLLLDPEIVKGIREVDFSGLLEEEE